MTVASQSAGILATFYNTSNSKSAATKIMDEWKLRNGWDEQEVEMKDGRTSIRRA